MAAELQIKILVEELRRQDPSRVVRARPAWDRDGYELTIGGHRAFVQGQFLEWMTDRYPETARQVAEDVTGHGEDRSAEIETEIKAEWALLSRICSPTPPVIRERMKAYPMFAEHVKAGGAFSLSLAMQAVLIDWHEEMLSEMVKAYRQATEKP